MIDDGGEKRWSRLSTEWVILLMQYTEDVQAVSVEVLYTKKLCTCCWRSCRTDDVQAVDAVDACWCNACFKWSTTTTGTVTLTGKLGRVATVEMCEMVRRQHEDRYWLLQLSMSAEESSGVEVMSANLSHFSLFRVVLLFSYHSPQSRLGGDSAQCAQWRAPFDSTALDPPLLITKVEDIFGQPHTTHPLCGHQHRQHHHHHHDLASQNWWCAELHCRAWCSTQWQHWQCSVPSSLGASLAHPAPSWWWSSSRSTNSYS